MNYPYQTADPAHYRLLRKHAQHNKNHPTEAEALLWGYLRADGLGVTFKRQHIIGDFIVDFVSLENKLVVEIDGEYHHLPAQMECDEIRTQWLKTRGYRVIRFTNNELFTNINKVLEKNENNLYE